MKFQKAQIFTLLFLLSSCSDQKGLEESVILFDPAKKELFIRMLDEKKVIYRINPDGQIFYPAEDKEIVIQAFETVTGNKIPDFMPPQTPQ